MIFSMKQGGDLMVTEKDEAVSSFETSKIKKDLNAGTSF